MQARQKFARARGQRARLPRREEVDRLAWNGRDFRKHRPQALVDRAQELPQLRADVVFRGPQLEGKETRWRELSCCLAEEFDCIEPVQLGVLRLRQIDNHDIEGGLRGFQKQPPVPYVHAHAGVSPQGTPLVRKVLSAQVQNGGVEFHVIHPFERVVPQSLRDAPVEPPANEQKTPG